MYGRRNTLLGQKGMLYDHGALRGAVEAIVGGMVNGNGIGGDESGGGARGRRNTVER